MNFKKLTAAFACIISLSATVEAQYKPFEAFKPFLPSEKSSYTRSASGKPSSHYWQNSTDYKIEASFDTASKYLNATVEIKYKNNSPDDLSCLWLELDQNQNNDASLSHLLEGHHDTDNTKGFHIKSVQRKNKNQWVAASYSVYGTMMQIQLTDILPAGSEISIAVQYDFQMQPSGAAGRTGYGSFKDGQIFDFSYWYPRMCVYDDLNGWNTLPFIGGGEFYSGYGNYDYKLTVPAGMLLIGTGSCENEKEILTDKILRHLAKAKNSDATVLIRDSADTHESVTKQKNGTVTWHYTMTNTRDIAWTLSKAFIWDAAAIRLPNGKSALAQSVYPREASKSWRRSTEFSKFSVEHFSDKWFVYPYPTATSVGGPVDGMEFPGMAYNGLDVNDYVMFLLASHELGHSWFPMIVGSDERRYPFMDEGFNTFIDILAHEYFNNGEFAPKRDGEYAPGKGNPADEIAVVISKYKSGPTLMTYADAQNYAAVHPLAYFKGAFGMVLLRDVILGKERFDRAFRQYIADWAFKHPSPFDFFNAMANNSGVNLDWFWRGWYFHNWETDFALNKVETTDSAGIHKAKITVQNLKEMPFPITIRTIDENGDKAIYHIPVEAWQYKTQNSIEVQTSSPLKSVQLDPENRIPDMNRNNDVWQR